MICASEVGTIPIDPSIVIHKGRLQPGKMLLVDTVEGRVVDDAELKARIATKHPFRKWVETELLTMDSIKECVVAKKGPLPELTSWVDEVPLSQDSRMLAFGFTLEQLNMIITPMVRYTRTTFI